jgi:uncharacterized membrane protein (DUF4010 family)
MPGEPRTAAPRWRCHPRDGRDPMNLDWLAEQGLERLPLFLTALAIGLLIGLERERNPTAKAGLRTMALVALSGAAAAELATRFAAPWIVAVGLAAVAFTMIAAYYHHHEEWHERDPGTTTIAAVIVCYLLAAMALAGFAQLAVILAILATILLYFKAELGGLARRLERRDLASILQFAVVAFVVLPMLPDRGYGPYAAFNPRHVWLMVVLISGLSLVGYVALRVIGPERGAALLGIFGGLVSSTATTLAYSRRGRDGDEVAALATTVILTANLVLLVRLAVLTLVLAPGVAGVLLPALGLAFATGGITTWLGLRRVVQARALALPEVGNPAELRTALSFAVLYAAVLLLVAWLADLAGSRGVYAVALVSGLTDVDAITLSSFRLHGLGTLSAGQVATSVLLAASTNAVFKLGIVRVAGGSRLFRRCLPAMGAMVAGAVLGIGLFA